MNEDGPLGLEAFSTDPMRLAQQLEERMAKEPTDPLIALELAVLYFWTQDFGVAAHLHLPWDWVDWAGRRLFEVLEAAKVRFPKNSDLAVWDEYIRLILQHKDEGDFLRALEVVRLRGDSDLPLVFLFPHDEACEAYRRGAAAVFERVRHRRTPSENYLSSILERDFGRRASRAQS
jgi:hypothetical protein